MVATLLKWCEWKMALSNVKTTEEGYRHVARLLVWQYWGRTRKTYSDCIVRFEVHTSVSIYHSSSMLNRGDFADRYQSFEKNCSLHLQGWNSPLTLIRRQKVLPKRRHLTTQPYGVESLNTVTSVKIVLVLAEFQSGLLCRSQKITPWGNFVADVSISYELQHRIHKNSGQDEISQNEHEE
jgi:hypothetical protein